jgi:hypothetical protein
MKNMPRENEIVLTQGHIPLLCELYQEEQQRNIHSHSTNRNKGHQGHRCSLQDCIYTVKPAHAIKRSPLGQRKNGLITQMTS